MRLPYVRGSWRPIVQPPPHASRYSLHLLAKHREHWIRLLELGSATIPVLSGESWRWDQVQRGVPEPDWKQAVTDHFIFKEPVMKAMCSAGVNGGGPDPRDNDLRATVGAGAQGEPTLQSSHASIASSLAQIAQAGGAGSAP